MIAAISVAPSAPAPAGGRPRTMSARPQGGMGVESIAGVGSQPAPMVHV